MINIKLSNGNDVNISKLPLKKYSELLKAFRQVPQIINELQGLKSENVFSILPDLIENNLPLVANIISIATDLKPEQVDKLGLDEVIDIVIAIIEENKYVQVYEKIKKAIPKTNNQILGETQI